MTDTEEYWAFKNSRNKKVAREAQVQHCSCQFFCLCSVAFQESCLHCRACTPPEDLAAGSGHFGLAAGLTGLWVRCWAGGGEGKEAACVLSLETFELSSPSPAFCGKQACLSGSEENLCFVSSRSNITVSTGGCSLQANSLSCTWWLFLTSSGVVVLTPHPAGGFYCGAELRGFKDGPDPLSSSQEWRGCGSCFSFKATLLHNPEFWFCQACTLPYCLSRWLVRELFL